MNNISSRHHYLPKFLIKGFVNNDEEVFVYDKTKQKILGKTFPPKSIFWEKDRNTLEFDTGKSSIIEEDTYAKIDNIGNEAVSFLKTVDLSKSEISIEYIYKLQIFILNLFWRIPSTDNLFDVIFEIINSNIPPEIKQRDSIKKHQRTYMFIHTLKRTIENLKNGKYRYKLIEFGSDKFVLSDSPTLYKRSPNNFDDLDNSSFIFPISSTRGFIQINEAELENNESILEKYSFWYNAVAIEQSTRFTVSPNIDILKKSIELYNHLKENERFNEMKDLLFTRIRF